MIKSYNISQGNINKIRLQNISAEKRLNIKIGESCLLENIITAFYRSSAEQIIDMENKIFEHKTQHLLKNYKKRINKISSKKI